MPAVAGPVPFMAQNAGPAMDGFAITPSDSTNMAAICRAIYVGVAGDVVLVTSQSTVLTFKNCPAGLIIPIAAIRVNNTNTTATNLIGII